MFSTAKDHLSNAEKFYRLGLNPIQKIRSFDDIKRTDNFFCALDELKKYCEKAKTFDKHELVGKYLQEIEVTLNNHLDEFDKIKKKYIMIGDFCNFVVLAHNVEDKLTQQYNYWYGIKILSNDKPYDKSADRIKKAEQQLLEKANTYFEEKNFPTAHVFFESANQIGLLDDENQKRYYTAKMNSHYRDGVYFMKRKEIESAISSFKIALGMGYPCKKEYRLANEKYCIEMAEKFEREAMYATLPGNKAKKYAMAEKMYEEASRLSKNPSQYEQNITQMQLLHKENRDAVKNLFKALGNRLLDDLLDFIPHSTGYNDCRNEDDDEYEDEDGFEKS